MTLTYELEVKKATLAANRLQEVLDALVECCAKPTLFLYGVQLSYVPHAKFLGINFDHKFNFKTL